MLLLEIEGLGLKGSVCSPCAKSFASASEVATRCRCSAVAACAVLLTLSSRFHSVVAA